MPTVTMAKMRPDGRVALRFCASSFWLGSNGSNRSDAKEKK